MPVFSLRRRFREVGWGLAWGLAGVVVCSTGLSLGCQPPVPNEIVGVNGPIHVDEITAILHDTSLDDTAKRHALRDLGITDEEFIDVLIRGLG
jgi:hypothetical protein